jgi:cellulose synthase (UDP-forming)
VLDDGRRPWLAEFCAEKGVRYLTRTGNKSAKAGNINAALSSVRGDLIAVLDADFVPRRNFLLRTVGFFRDSAVACVQTPQSFFNKDPIQINLGLGTRWSDDQRLFYDVVQPSRDAWGAAFCCGTGVVIRRSSLDAIGGVPTGSVCEDMLMSLQFIRRKQRTLYLNEPLCIGLAPESLEAMFVQRKRWCRGQIQMLFLKCGQFAPGLPLLHRFLFLPTYWMFQLPSRVLFLFMPLIYFWTGLAPLHIADQMELSSHFMPVLITSIGFICWIASGSYFPILSDATNILIGARIIPTVVASVIKPFGEPFRVTPKGKAANSTSYHRGSFWFFLLLFLGNLVGLAWNAFLPIHPVEDMTAFQLAAGWAVFNCIIIAFATLIARERPRYRTQERFPLGLAAASAIGHETVSCTLANASLSGAFIRFGNNPLPSVGDEIRVSAGRLGTLRGRVVRQSGDGAAIRFEHLASDARDALNQMFLQQLRGATKHPRQAHRQPINAAGRCVVSGDWNTCVIVDASLSGAFIVMGDGQTQPKVGDPIATDFPEVGLVEGTIIRATPGGLGVLFDDMPPNIRDRLIRLLYTTPDSGTLDVDANVPAILKQMGRAAFGPEAA